MRGRTAARLGLFAASGLVAGACAPAGETTAQRAEPDAPTVVAARDAEDVVEDASTAALREALAQRDRELAELRASVERAAAGPSRQQLLDRVSELEIELGREQAERLAREQEWLRFTRAISSLELASLPDELEFVPEVPEVEPPPAPEPERSAAELERERRLARAAEIQTTLSSLLTIEEVGSLSVLDVGELGDGWIGPVLFRINGAGGRLAGSLYAERLSLEGSRAGRTLTIVLEEGYETRAGERVPFARPNPLLPPRRRIVLPYLDPTRWAESLPELFASEPLEELADDGQWNLAMVRGTLNLLLREDAAQGWFKLRSLGGVTGDVLRAVHLEELDAQGRTRRHVFADRLKISIKQQGVLVELEDGASLKGEQKTPFVDGALRLYFPRANHAHWSDEHVPLFDRGPLERAAPVEPVMQQSGEG